MWWKPAPPAACQYLLRDNLDPYHLYHPYHTGYKAQTTAQSFIIMIYAYMRICDQQPYSWDGMLTAGQGSNEVMRAAQVIRGRYYILYKAITSEV